MNWKLRHKNKPIKLFLKVQFKGAHKQYRNSTSEKNTDSRHINMDEDAARFLERLQRTTLAAGQ